MAERKGGSVSDLMEDLADVSKWHSLGTHLGLTASQLDVIEQEIPAGVDAIQRRKRRVLDTWMKGKTGDPSWRDVVSALMKMGENSIAEEMRRKYSGSVPVKSAVNDAFKKENQQQIREKFVEFQILVCRKLQAMDINMKEFIFYLEGLFQCTDFIPASKEIDDIFKSMTRNGLWDFLNFSPLRAIINKFGRNDEDIMKDLKEYECALAGYHAGTSLVDHIAGKSSFPEKAFDDADPSVVIARRDPRYFRKLSITTNAKFTEKTVQYLIELWDRVSGYLCPPSLIYLLDEIHDSCISVTVLIPPLAMPAIALKIDDPETAKFFSKLGIIRMEVDDLCLYEEQEPSVETATEQKLEQEVEKEASQEVAKQQEQDSSLEQFLDSQEPVEKEASQGVAKGTAEQEQGSSSEELPQHDEEEGGWREQLEALQKTVSIERKIRKRTEEKNGELRAAIAYKKVEIGQLREKITGLECTLRQTREELREQATAQKEETPKSREQMERELSEMRGQREQIQKTTISKPDPHNCKAVGRGLQFGETKQIAQFQVRLTSANGEPCAERQEVRAELKSLVDGSITRAKVSHQTRSVGSYEVSYQPSIRGRHELSVLVNDAAIAGSPFKVYVQQPPQLMGRPVRVISGLSGPRRATLNSSGQLIVTELAGGRMSVFDGQGELVRRIDSLGPWYSRVKLDPTGVAIDDSGILYVCDGIACKLFKVSLTGKVLKSVGGVGSGPGQFYYPDGIALRDNMLYICDCNNHRIQIFSCDLNFISSLGSHGSGEGEFSSPRDIALDQEGNMYVVEYGTARVQVFSPSGTFLRTFGKPGSGSGKLSGPVGIHVDHNIVYITEYGNDCISIFTTLGEFISSFRRRGREEGEFSYPVGITMDCDGFLYVCDEVNDRIQMF